MLFKEGDPDYRMLLADRIYKAFFNDGALTPARSAERLTKRCNEIRRAFFAEAARWNYLTPAAWTSRRDYSLNEWLPRRTAEAFEQFRAAGFYPQIDAPILDQQGGPVVTGFQVRFVRPVRGRIYFTTDGTDPRLPGGAISARAKAFPDAPPLISRDTTVKSRVRNGDEWSALNEAFFTVGPGARE